MKNYIIYFLLSFAVTLVLMPVFLFITKRKNMGQTILGYVENHKDKNGTPTMAGVVFLIVSFILPLFLLKYDTDWFVTLIASAFFGILGFMDDFIKLKFKQNLGLRPYQKIIGQVGISLLFAIYVYLNVGSTIYIPFVNVNIDLGWFIIPFIMLTIIATTNSVNLTDGIDGLAGNTTVIFLLFFVLICLFLKNSLYSSGETGKIIDNLSNVVALSSFLIGSIMAFLVFNTNKAKCFMGDVGSLYLGGFLSCISSLVGLELFIIILGFCFVFSAISVIIQVVSFKLTKKRVFKMTPFHHHLQLSGFSEAQIVYFYALASTILGLFCLIPFVW